MKVLITGVKDGNIYALHASWNTHDLLASDLSPPTPGV